MTVSENMYAQIHIYSFHEGREHVGAHVCQAKKKIACCELTRPELPNTYFVECQNMIPLIMTANRMQGWKVICFTQIVYVRIHKATKLVHEPQSTMLALSFVCLLNLCVTHTITAVSWQ